MGNFMATFFIGVTHKVTPNIDESTLSHAQRKGLQRGDYEDFNRMKFPQKWLSCMMLHIQTLDTSLLRE